MHDRRQCGDTDSSQTVKASSERNRALNWRLAFSRQIEKCLVCDYAWKNYCL